MKRFAVMAAMLALVVPAGAHADGTTYAAPYQAGPRGGDMYNQFNSDPSTGSMAVLRLNPSGPSGGLGCGGQGGYDNFLVVHQATTPVTTVTVAYDNALVDPYTFVDVGVRSGVDDATSTSTPIAATVDEGPIAGSGTEVVDLGGAYTGPITVWFGIQVASACPNVDGGMATFTSVTFS